MIVVGLTGGVASGKSFVAQCLEELGAHRIDADQVAHEVLKDKSVIDKIVDLWGTQLVGDDGQIIRGRLAKVVFDGADEENLDLLESIVHPEIRIRIHREMDSIQVAPCTDMLVLDIPLLFEGEYNRKCDYVLFVDAKLKIRQQRALHRGWKEDELAKRESRQLPIEEKKLRSDFVIDNSGSKESTAQQLADFCKSIGRKVPDSFCDLYFNTPNDKDSNSNPSS